MSSATTTILPGELDELAAALLAVQPIDVPFNTLHNNWSFPALTRADLAMSFVGLKDRIVLEIKIGAHPAAEELAAQLNLLADRAAYVRQNVLPQLPSNPLVAVAALISLIEAVRSRADALQFKRLGTESKPEDLAKDVAAAKKMRTEIRNGENILKEAQPRLDGLTASIDSIIAAQSAMAQLPEDLVSLREKRDQVEDMVTNVLKMCVEADRAVLDLTEKIKKQEDLHERAEKTLERADEAYRANTSQGLASAFKERADSLTSSVWFWVGGLVAALVAGGILGYFQLDRLTMLLDKAAASQGHAGSTIWIEFVLSILSIGGPFWFAWVSTKQIGQRFKLAEDYGYKASISKAYEGYRQEAVRLDPDFQSRLFASALTRLEEIPLRVMDQSNHGSPWHALLDSDVFQQAMKTVPLFGERVLQLAKDAMPAAKDAAKSGVDDAAQKIKSVANDAIAPTEAEKA